MLKNKKKFIPIKKGEKVGIFVPSSPVKEPFRSKGLKWLKKTGLVPMECNNIFNIEGFVAKEPIDILNDIKIFLENKEIRILWAARGGYGSNYLLPLLKDFLKNIEIPGPKIIIGSSDVSYLLWSLFDIPEITLLYGPMIYSSIAEEKFNERQLTEMLFSRKKEFRIIGEVLIEGKCEGILTGGCLSNLVSLIGTPYLPEVNKRVLLLEDINERPYRLDRMFWQLKHYGVFDSISGLVLGEFPGCFKNEVEKKDFYLKIKEYLLPYNIPVIIKLPLGHSDNIHIIQLGVKTAIDTSK